MNNKNIFYGIFFILLGIVVGLATFDLIPYYIFFDGWWTFFIIVPCAVSIIYDGNKIWNVIGLVFGLCLLLECQDLFNFEIVMDLFIPLILIFIGFSLLFKKNKKITYSEVSNDNKEEIKNVDIKKVNDSDIIHLSSFLGTNKYDLSDNKFKNGDMIKVSAILGKCYVTLPKNINIKVLSGNFLGDVFNKKIKDVDNKITVTIDCGIFIGSIYINDEK